MTSSKTFLQFTPALFLGAICFVVGCGDSGRLPIKGTVSIDGEPVKKGFIHFTPLPGTKGPTAGANIVDGSYEVDPSKGVFEGNFRVNIKDWRESKKKTEDPVTGEISAGVKQFLPPKFNSKSELTVEIKRGGESYDFPLEL